MRICLPAVLSVVSTVAATGGSAGRSGWALSGAAEALRTKLIQMIGDKYFKLYRRGDTAREAIFTRKVGHTQRVGFFLDGVATQTAREAVLVAGFE